MSVLIEGDIQMSLPSGAVGQRFDDDTTHGLSHCMKAVDFVVALKEKILFIEVKDPEDPAVPDASRREFVESFQSGALDADLVGKYRDTFLYEWAAERLGRPVEYRVVIAISAIDEALLLARTEELKRRLPVDGPRNGAWKRRIVHKCVVCNIELWNRHFPEFNLRRRGKA